MEINMTIQDRATTISTRQKAATDLANAGQALFGPDWKAPLAAALMVRTSSIDDMSTGRSRIPPTIWNEIAAFIQDREHQLRVIKVDVLEHAGAPAHRLYRGPDGIEFGVYPDIHGVYPKIQFTRTPGGAHWEYLSDDQRRLPDGTLACCLEFLGQMGEPMPMRIGATVSYPPNYLRAA
jgi:hypothetical protein